MVLSLVRAKCNLDASTERSREADGSRRVDAMMGSRYAPQRSSKQVKHQRGM
jgi:hypothetical protein